MAYPPGGRGDSANAPTSTGLSNKLLMVILSLDELLHIISIWETIKHVGIMYVVVNV